MKDLSVQYIENYETNFSVDKNFEILAAKGVKEEKIIIFTCGKSDSKTFTVHKNCYYQSFRALNVKIVR